MVWCGSMNGYQEAICLKDSIGLRDENMITNLHAIVNIIGVSLYDHLMSTRIFAFDNEEDIHIV